MSHFIDEIGKTYGKLTVVSRATSTNLGVTRWLCLCECGNSVVVRGACLRRKAARDNRQSRHGTISCGCKRKELKLARGEAAARKLFYQYKRAAAKRSLTWSISREDFDRLTRSCCHYCGSAPKHELKTQSDNGVRVYNGLDRIDSSSGYVLDNVVTCCGDCNTAKSDLGYAEFLSLVENIYLHRCSRRSYAVVSV